jgi:hypothetical protein
MSNIFGFVFKDGMDDVVKFSADVSLDEMGQDGIREIVEALAKKYSSWEAVLQGRCAALLFDEGNMQSKRINWNVR